MKADGLIYLAGTLATEGDIKAQTKKVLDDLSQTLQKAGSSIANVAGFRKQAVDYLRALGIPVLRWPGG